MKNVTDLTQDELDKKLTLVVEKLIQDAFDSKGFITYQDERCTTGAEFIKQYPDGREELVLLNSKREYEFIKELR
jgi:hypothetical protein